MAALVASAMLFASPASAAEVFVRTATIGSPGAGNGELSLGEHSGVAVNGTSGDVYVADTGNGRVEQFEADGTFVRVFGSFGSPTFIAIDNSGSTPSGDVYVADSGAGTVSKFAADGSAITTWGTGGQLAGFTAIYGIAVGPEGDLFVLNEGTASRFDPAGNPVGGPFETPRESSPAGLAVDPEGNLYKATGGGEIIKFDNTGARLAEPDTRTDANALTTDPESGDLLVAQGNQGVPMINRYALNCGEACDPLETFGLNELSLPSGIAIGPGDVRYVADAGASAIAVFTLQTVEPPTVSAVAVTALTGTSAHLSGEVNPNGFATFCRFEVVTDARFAEDGFADATRVPCATSPGSGSSPVAVAADAEGLTPATGYHARLVASNAAGPTASPEPNPTFTTEAVAPTVKSQSVIGVGLTAANLEAVVVPGGAATTYRFEYLDEAAYLAEGFASPDTRSTDELGPLPADNSPHSVSATITGLEIDTAYRFRTVATNSVGAVAGEPAGSFRTQRSTVFPVQACPNQVLRIGPAAGLPDCRGYEQATPADKGGLYAEGFADLVIAAADGSGVTFTSTAGSGIPATGGARQDTTTYLSSLDAGSWATQRLLPPEELGEKAELLGASRNLRFALVVAGHGFNSDQPGTDAGLFIVDTATEDVTQIVPHQSGLAFNNAFWSDAIADDGSRVFFEAKADLGLAPETTPPEVNLFMWERSTGEVSLAGALPADEGGGAPTGGSFGGAYAWYFENTEVGGASAGLYVEAAHAASADGDQIYFTAGDTGQLYLRHGLTGPGPTTVHVSRPAAGVTDPFGPRPAAFQEATPDGSHAFFTSPEKLTEDASTGGTDLYRYDESEDRLVDVTGGLSDAENPNGAEVLGLLGASSDGSSGYFAARGAVAPGAVIGGKNIYRFEEDGTGDFALTFVAESTGEGVCKTNWSPSSFCSVGTISEYQGKRSRVTPDGQTLVFTVGGDIYRYSATEEALSCISCDPTGATPVGPAELTAGFINAANFKAPLALPAARLTRNVSEDGSRVFFQTPNSLVAEDTNGPADCTYLIDHPAIGKNLPSCVDVYEWEAPGAPGGSCTKAEVNGGCLYLLSTGKSDQGSYFMDASSDGKSAFIATTSQLVPVDRDELYDVYDVRTDGGIASQHVMPGKPCEGESCLGAAAAPSMSPAAGSSSFSGPGNVKPKKHKRCQRNHRRCHGKNKHKSHKGKKHGQGKSGKGEQK